MLRSTRSTARIVKTLVVTDAHRTNAQRLLDTSHRPHGTRQRYHFDVLRVGDTLFLVPGEYTSPDAVRACAHQFVAKNPGWLLRVRQSRKPNGVFITCRAKPGSRWNPQPIPTPAAPTAPAAPKERRTLTFRGLTRREAMLLLDPAADVSNVSGGNLFTAAEVALLTERLPPV